MDDIPTLFKPMLSKGQLYFFLKRLVQWSVKTPRSRVLILFCGFVGIFLTKNLISLNKYYNIQVIYFFLNVLWHFVSFHKPIYLTHDMFLCIFGNITLLPL